MPRRLAETELIKTTASLTERPPKYIPSRSTCPERHIPHKWCFADASLSNFPLAACFGRLSRFLVASEIVENLRRPLGFVIHTMH